MYRISIRLLCIFSLVLFTACDDSDSTSNENKNCGNGIIDEGETCDDGPKNGEPNHCNSTCDGITEAVCGNGIIEEGEACDDAGESAKCNADCTLAECGDGIVNTWAGETCDDGDKNGEPNHCNEFCDGTTRPLCGNGVVEEGEACDDGDNNGEPNHCNRACSDMVKPLCGNGVIEEGEECDDGKETETCNADCTLAACGDGIINEWAGEVCDDGEHNGKPGYCTQDCTEIVTCGNGQIDPGEACDDGENNGQEGYCNADCTGVDDAICGNGIVEEGEACDDGEETETCNADCTLAECGDGIVNHSAGEACDDGGESAACTAECTAKTTIFRFDTVKFIDPHLYFDFLGCRDITNEVLGNPDLSANGMLKDGLEKTKNGSFNTSLGLLTRPLNQLPGAQTDVEFVFPKCDAPLGECTADTSKPFIEGTLHNQESGYCLPVQDQPGRNHDYTGLHQPKGPCFLSDPMHIDISIRGITLALLDARVTATYDGNSATRLTDGILVGFLPEEAAQEAIIPAPDMLGGDTPLYEFLKGGGACGSGNDMDTHNGDDGWWFYLNFTAEIADGWNE